MAEALTIVERYFAAFGTGDVEGALACVHPRAIWHVDGDPALVTVGITRGKAAVRDWLRRFPDGFRPIAFSVARLIEAGPDVIALGRFRHLVQATGAIVDSDYALRLTVTDGLIARYQIFEDSLLLAEAHRSASPAHIARINGTDYGWDDVGQGPPMVFLHGLFLDRTFWSPHIRSLATRWRCVSFDMPGHGVSGWRDGLDLDGIAEDLALWLVEHAAAGATLVGHSQGGMIAMRIAARWPELVNRLVLVNTSARAEAPERLPAWRERRDALGGGLAERERLFAAIQCMKATPAWLASHPEEAAAERAMMMRHDPLNLVKALDAAVLERGDIRSVVPDVATKTVVLSGELDQATPPEFGIEIAELLADAEHIVVEDVGHHIPVEKAAEMISAIDGTASDCMVHPKRSI